MALCLKGVSKRIDGCTGLLFQKARQIYFAVPDAHKRWMDIEDVLQEELLAAHLAEKKYDKEGGRKFSTFLYQRLEWQAKSTYSQLRDPMRSASLVELDAPIPGIEDKTMELPVAPEQGVDEDGVRSFITLCRVVSPPAVTALVYGFLCGNGKKATPEICAEIAAAAAKLKIDSGALCRVGADEKSRKKALTQLSRNVIMSLDTEAGLRILECVECGGTFTIEAIREGRFIVETMTCRMCYRQLQALPAILSCFGKRDSQGTKGYSEADAACRIHCQDRKVCRQYIKEQVMEDETKATADELEDVDLGDIEEKKGKVKTAKKPTAGAKAVAKKTAKKKEEDDDVPPKEVGPRWPYKKDSQRRWAFQAMYDGIKEADFLENCKKYKMNPKAILKSMRGGPGVKRSTHSWKLNEEGKRYKIYDVKYTGKVKTEKAPAKKTTDAKATKTAGKPAKKKAAASK